jgi:hypothetical protein
MREELCNDALKKSNTARKIGNNMFGTMWEQALLKYFRAHRFLRPEKAKLL